jgi:hypothetical protein
MLRLELDREYIVYPSWIEPAYEWTQIPDIIANPLKYHPTVRLTYTDEELRKFGYFDAPKPYRMIPGPAGWGIVEVQIKRGERWPHVGSLCFDKGVDMRYPPTSDLANYQPNVSYMEPTVSIGWYFGSGRRRKDYSIPATYEHVETAGEQVYWLFSARPTRKGLPEILEVPYWAKAFDLKVKLLTEIPKEVLDETLNWRKQDYQFFWFSVEGAGDKLGYYFAAMFYIGLHLSFITKKKVYSAHLLAQIEGKPQVFAAGKARLRDLQQK